MGVHWNSVSLYRKKAVATGVLLPYGQYVPQRIAGTYRFSTVTRVTPVNPVTSCNYGLVTVLSNTPSYSPETVPLVTVMESPLVTVSESGEEKISPSYSPEEERNKKIPEIACESQKPAENAAICSAEPVTKIVKSSLTMSESALAEKVRRSMETAAGWNEIAGRQ
jgi:hypothetical protein